MLIRPSENLIIGDNGFEAAYDPKAARLNVLRPGVYEPRVYLNEEAVAVWDALRGSVAYDPNSANGVIGAVIRQAERRLDAIEQSLRLMGSDTIEYRVAAIEERPELAAEPTEPSDPPASGLLYAAAVCEATGFSREDLIGAVAGGRFPVPSVIGGSTVWRRESIDWWVKRSGTTEAGTPKAAASASEPTKDAEPVPCPFCGAIPEITGFDGQLKQIGCRTHACQGSNAGILYRTRERAVAAWNRRAQSPDVVGTVPPEPDGSADRVDIVGPRDGVEPPRRRPEPTTAPPGPLPSGWVRVGDGTLEEPGDFPTEALFIARIQELNGPPPISEAEGRLRELLAVILGDGGRAADEHGLAVSAAKAREVVVEMRARPVAREGKP